MVLDPEKKLTISNKTHHSIADYNLFEGTQGDRHAGRLLVRGQVVVEDDKLVAQPGHGQFVKRANFGEELHGEGEGDERRAAPDLYAKAGLGQQFEHGTKPGRRRDRLLAAASPTRRARSGPT